MTAQRIDELISACKGTGIGLAGLFPRRFSPATAVLKAAVDAGRFGRIRLVEAAIKWWRSQEYYDSGAWRGTGSSTVAGRL